MQTVTFSCPHCNNLMAVGTELLGQQVRCPTCQQIVIAPTPDAPPPVQEGAISQISLEQPTKVEGHDSIFGESDGEALFGSAPPKVEVPAEKPTALGATNFAAYPPGVPNPAEVQINPVEVAPESAQPQASVAPTMPEPFIEPASNQSFPATDQTYSAGAIGVEQSQTQDTASAAATPDPWTAATASVLESPGIEQPWAPSPLGLGEMENGQGAMRRSASAGEQRKGTNLLLTILGPYSVVMTLAAGWYFYKSTNVSNVDHPFANIPDIIAQYEPATRKQLSRRIDGMPAVDAPLPESLLVKLGETLRVGDMEVTPEKVEQGTITVHTVSQDEQASAGQLAGESLILHLRVKNRSSDVYFQPTDPVFNRYYDRRTGNSKPYTQLVVGNQHFYGGPIDVLRANSRRIKRQYVSGQDNDDRPLPPGEERQTVICSDGQDGSTEAVKNYTGGEPILWRVELRRGLTNFHGQDLSVCAVIGVQFNPGDVQKAKR